MADIDSIKKGGYRALAERVRKLEVEDIFPELEPDLLEEGVYFVEGGDGKPLTEAATARYSRAKNEIAERLDKLGA